MINLPITGLSNDNTKINSISNDRESDSTKDLHENETNRKAYPQRNNRAKLNYRDIERGMYEEIRQSMWAVGGSTLINKNNTHYRDDGEDDDEDIIDLSMDDDDDDEKSMDNNDQMHRRLWCICKKPWDHLKLMLRCDSCANWYHGDCIGVSREQAKVLELNGDQFICPSCRGISHSTLEAIKSSEESIVIKRKHSDDHKKRPKSNIFFQRDLSTNSQMHCIVHNCDNRTTPDWVYCSPACIRRHINDTLQAIQRSKGVDNEDIPTNEDILLYESKSNKILEKNLIPKIEDLCTWINQHPSYEIIKPSLRQSILLRTKQSTDFTRSFSSINNNPKSKTSSTSMVGHQRTNTKTIPNKKSAIQLIKLTSKTTSNMNNTVDIRSKVPTALYDKIKMRLEKSGEKDLLRKDIRSIVNKIEEEMFRVYGKVDNSYKNKFRSLLANISNLNNNFFYKQILSKELTAKEIVAMKPEDMLPPEEKEKRKDQFEKEVQMIINAQQQAAEEMARRVKMKKTRQGFVDNDAHLTMLSLKDKVEEPRDDSSTNIAKKNIEIEPTISTAIDKNEKSIIPIDNEKSIAKIGSDNQVSSSILPDPIFSAADLDNDYIEPESPTGIDALIYDDDDDDNDDDLYIIHTSSRPLTTHSPVENTEYIPPHQQTIRDDYNPSKTKNETTPIAQSTSVIRLPNQWRGVIQSSDAKIPCQSVHIYGESDNLIGHIPEQLTILGRLRLGDLWDYIRDSLTVRDVIILTLTSSSSSLSTTDNDIFSQYVDTMHASGRAAVINKCPNPSLIRDMYILAADTKMCPSNVLCSLFLPITFESKQLFLVIIGSGKRTTKSINRSNENQLLNNLSYKPVVLQKSTVIRDPRLLRNKDPRLNKSRTTSENITRKYSNEDLLKLMSDSLERIHHSSTADDIRSIVMSTMEILKANRRDDLCARFTDDHRTAITEWQTTHANTSIPTATVVPGDNLTEENMDVDDEQDDKHKKQITTSSTSNTSSRFNDIDDRFLNQDMNQHVTTTDQVADHRKQRRRSRFSDLSPLDINRTRKPKSIIPIEKVFSKGKQKSAIVNADGRRNNTKVASSKSTDKHINPSLSSKFRPVINSTESFISTTNTEDKVTSKPIRFSFSKDPLQRHKSDISSITNDNDIYESSPSIFEDLIKQVQSCGYEGLSLSNDNWAKQTLPITPIRSTAMLNLVIQQQKTKNRFSSGSNNNHITHYHDFDQPQE